MTWKEMDQALTRAKTTRDLAKKFEILASLLVEAGIDPATTRHTRDVLNKLEGAVRVRCLSERGISPGMTVVYGYHPPMTPMKGVVNTIGALGWVTIVGVRGSFNPMNLRLPAEVGSHTPAQ